MRTTLSLAPNVFARECDGLVIFLDLKADRYLALNAQQSRWYRALRDNIEAVNSSAPCSQLAVRLEEKGLIVPTTAGGAYILSASIPPARDSVPVERLRLQKTRPLEFTKIAWMLLRAGLTSHTQSILQIVDSHRRSKKRIPAAPEAETEVVFQHASDFHRLAPLFFSMEGACRFHSIALLRYLAAARIPADWVFGVRLSPFAAHCWVEWNSTVLNDDIDHVREFQPILRV